MVDLLEQKEIVCSWKDRAWAGFMVLAAWTQERMLQRQKRSALPLLAALLLHVLQGPLEFRRK